jgi:hypothetical protein
MSIVRSPVRSCVRSPVQGVFGGSASLLEQATSALGNVAPYHYADFITNRMLYAGADVGTVAGGTGYSFTRASDGYYTNSDGTLTLFGSGALRRGDRGVLIEGSRTNLLLRSQEFDNAAWTKIGSSVTANATAAPDGTITADKLVENSATSDHYMTHPATTTAAGYTFTVYAKAAERTWLAMLVFDSGGVARTTYFDVGNGAVGTVGVGVTASITALANGWYLCRATIATAFNGTNAAGARIYLANGDTVFSYAGDGTSGLFLWQADYQLGAFPSSPIVTVAAAATRAADVLTYTAGVSYPLSLWAEFERAVDTGGIEALLSTDNGSTTDRGELFIGSADTGKLFVRQNSNTQADVTVAGAVAINAITKLAGRVATDDVRAARGGTLSDADTSAVLPASPTRIVVGSTNGTASFAFGYIRRAAVFTTALTDAQLQTTTS